MKLTLDIEGELSLLEKYRLTCDELMFIRTLLIYQEDGNEELFKKYFLLSKTNNIDIKELLISLQNKGIILKSFKVSSGTFNPMEVPFNKNVIKFLFKSSFEMGKELFENYPAFNTINGSCVALRGVSKHFNSLEEAYYRYGKIIKFNPELHEEIIELVKWAKENNILCQSLSSFIINNAWGDLNELKNGDKGYNYDAIKMV